MSDFVSVVVGLACLGGLMYWSLSEVKKDRIEYTNFKREVTDALNRIANALSKEDL